MMTSWVNGLHSTWESDFQNGLHSTKGKLNILIYIAPYLFFDSTFNIASLESIYFIHINVY